MALTTENSGGLVAGAFGRPEPTMSVRLLKAICIAGNRVEPGVMDLPKQLATMLIGSNKAERVAAVAKPAPEPPPAEVKRAPSPKEK